MWHCLYAYRIVGDTIYGLSELVPYGSIFILCSFFSCTFFGCLHPNGKSVAFEEEILFSGIKVSMQLSFSTDIYLEITFVNLLES